MAKAKVKEFEVGGKTVVYDPKIRKAVITKQPLTKEEKVEFNYITEAVKMANSQNPKTKKKKPEKPATAEPKPETEVKETVAAVTTDRILAAMKEIEGDITSTVLRDKLGVSRGYVRRAMKQLAEEGKVTVGIREGTKRKQVYKLAET